MSASSKRTGKEVSGNAAVWKEKKEEIIAHWRRRWCLEKQAKKRTEITPVFSLEITRASLRDVHSLWISFLTVHPRSVGRIWRPFGQSVLFFNRWILFTKNTWKDTHGQTIKLHDHSQHSVRQQRNYSTLFLINGDIYLWHDDSSTFILYSQETITVTL